MVPKDTHGLGAGALGTPKGSSGVWALRAPSESEPSCQLRDLRTSWKLAENARIFLLCLQWGL